MTVNRLPIAFIYSVNSFIGIIGNTIMIACFFKNQKLRSPCHILVTLLCFCDIWNLSGCVSYSISVFANLTTTQSSCFFVQAVPVMGAAAGSTLILAMGIDRLFGVYFLTRYRVLGLRKQRYLAVLLVFPLVYTLSIGFIGYVNRLQNNATQILCTFPRSMNGPAFKIFLLSSVIINILILSIYSAVYLSLLTHNTSTRFKRVFHSIAVTVVLVLFGWITSSLWSMFTVMFITDPIRYESFSLYCGLPVQLSLSTNVFVFYCINPDYRKTINSLFVFHKTIKILTPIRESGMRVGASSLF